MGERSKAGTALLVALLVTACGSGDVPARATDLATPAPPAATAGSASGAEGGIDAHLVTVAEFEQLAGVALRLADGPRDARHGGVPPLCGGPPGLELAGHDFTGAPHRVRWLVVSEPAFIGGASVLQFEDASAAQEMLAEVARRLDDCSEFELMRVAWTVDTRTGTGGGPDALWLRASSEQSYPPGRLDALGPAGYCWAYAVTEERLTTAGLVGPAATVTEETCSELAAITGRRAG